MFLQSSLQQIQKTTIFNSHARAVHTKRSTSSRMRARADDNSALYARRNCAMLTCQTNSLLPASHPHLAHLLQRFTGMLCITCAGSRRTPGVPSANRSRHLSPQTPTALGAKEAPTTKARFFFRPIRIIFRTTNQLNFQYRIHIFGQ